MAKYAIVDDETQSVWNVTEWDGESEWAPPEGFSAVLATDEVERRGQYVDGVYVPPEPLDVAPTVTPEQQQIADLQQQLADTIAAVQAVADASNVVVSLPTPIEPIAEEPLPG